MGLGFLVCPFSSHFPAEILHKNSPHYCIAIPLYFHVVPSITEAFIILWDKLFYPLLTPAAVPVLSATVSLLFPRSHRLEIIDDQEFSSALYTDTSLSPANSPDIITINLSPSVSKLRSADEMGGSRCKLPRPSESERDQAPDCIR
jgi:hypothetical protein